MIPKGTFAGAFFAGIMLLGATGFTEDAAPTVLIKSFETDGNKKVSNLAIQAIFERTLGVWPIPQDGLTLSPQRVENLLVAVGEYYFQRGHGGTFVYVPKDALETTEPPKLKEDKLVIAFMEGGGKAEIPLPAPAWLSARGPLTPTQEAIAEANQLKEEVERERKAREAAQAEERKAREAAIERSRAEGEAKLRARIEARRRAVQAAMDKQKLDVEARAQKDGGALFKITRFEIRGNNQISSAAIETVFERSVGLWPLPAAGVTLSRKQIQTLLEDIGNFYQKREHGGVFVYIAKADVVEDQAFKWNTLRVRVIESKEGEVVEPVESWIGVSGPIDTKQSAIQAAEKAKALIAEAQKKAEEDAKARAEVERQAEEVRRAAAAVARQAAIDKFNQQETAKGAQEPLLKVTSFAVAGNEHVSTAAFNALLERNLGFWPLPEGGVSISQSTLKKYLEDVGGFYAMRDLGGTFIFIENDRLAQIDPPSFKDDLLQVRVQESREGKPAIASPAWLFTRAPLSDAQAESAALAKAGEEAERLRKVREAESEKERLARLEAIEKSRREADAITRARMMAFARAQAEANEKLSAEAAAAAKAKAEENARLAVEQKVAEAARLKAEAEAKVRAEAEAKALAEAERQAEEARRAAIAAARQAAIDKFNQQETAKGEQEPLIKVTSFAVEGNERVSTAAFQALLERNLGFWPLPEGGISISRSSLNKYLEEVGDFYSIRELGGSFIFIENDRLAAVDPPSFKDDLLQVNVQESREGKPAIASPAWMFIRAPLSDAQVEVAARIKAAEEAELLRKAREAEAIKERTARLDAIEKSRREAAAISRAQTLARERAQTEAVNALKARVIEIAKAKEEEGGGVLIKVVSFSAEGNESVTYRALENMFIQHILGIEEPTLLPARELLPKGGINIRPDTLREFLEEILRFYTGLGHQGVYVYVPQESFEPSNEPLRLKLKYDDLHIKIVEGKIRRVTTDYEVTKRPRPWTKVLWRDRESKAADEKESFVERRRREHIEQNSPFKPGDPIRKDKLERYVDFLERRSGSVAAVIQKIEDGPVSEVGGDVEVQLRVRAYDPLTFYIESSDVGSETTEKIRYRAGLTHGDITGRGDVLALDFSSALDFNLNNFSAFASYDAPLWDPRWRGRILGAYSEFESVDLLGPGTAFLGDGVVLGSEISYNVLHVENWFVDVFQGFDFQNSNVQTPFGLNTQVNTFDVVLGARIENTSRKWAPNFQAKFAYNLSDFAGMSDADDFNRSRIDTEPGYFYFDFTGGHTYTFNFARVEMQEEKEKAAPANRALGLSPIAKRQRLRDRLPPGNWLSVTQNFRALYTPNRLPSAKQIFIGGASTIRGYEQSEASGDVGFYLTNELRLSVSEILARRKAQRLPVDVEVGRSWADDFSFEIVPLSFDYGVVFNNDASASEEDSLILLSTGGGGRLSFKNMLFARVYGGVALRDAGDDPEDDTQVGDHAIHFDLTIRF